MAVRKDREEGRPTHYHAMGTGSDLLSGLQGVLADLLDYGSWRLVEATMLARCSISAAILVRCSGRQRAGQRCWDRQPLSSIPQRRQDAGTLLESRFRGTVTIVNNTTRARLPPLRSV